MKYTRTFKIYEILFHRSINLLTLCILQISVQVGYYNIIYFRGLRFSHLQLTLMPITWIFYFLVQFFDRCGLNFIPKSVFFYGISPDFEKLELVEEVFDVLS